MMQAAMQGLAGQARLRLLCVGTETLCRSTIHFWRSWPATQRCRHSFTFTAVPSILLLLRNNLVIGHKCTASDHVQLASQALSQAASMMQHNPQLAQQIGTMTGSPQVSP